MTQKEIIYIIAIGAIALYAVALTVVLIVMGKRFKITHAVLEQRIIKNTYNIQNAEKTLQKSVEDIDNRLTTEKENNEKRIGELFDNTLSATTMLVEEKTKNISQKMDDISVRLNIIDSTIKNIESEKTFVRNLLKQPIDEQPIEAQYANVPKDGFLNNARKAVKNAAKAGGSIVKSLFGNKSDE